MTTTAATVQNLANKIQNRSRVLQLTNKNTNKIAGSNLLKRIQRHCKFMESKVEECHEIKAIEQILQIRQGDEEDVITDRSLGIQGELGKYEKMVEGLEDLEQS